MSVCYYVHCTENREITSMIHEDPSLHASGTPHTVPKKNHRRMWFFFGTVCLPAGELDKLDNLSSSPAGRPCISNLSNVLHCQL